MTVVHKHEPEKAPLTAAMKAQATLQMIMQRAEQKVQQSSKDITLATLMEAFNAGYEAHKAETNAGKVNVK